MAKREEWSTCNCQVLRNKNHVQVAVAFAHEKHAMEVLHLPEEDRYVIRVVNKEDEYCRECLKMRGKYLRNFEMAHWKAVRLPNIQACVGVLRDPRSGLSSYLLEHPSTTLHHYLTSLSMRHEYVKKMEQPLPENLIWRALMELLQALAWAASAGVTYGGVTSERALLFSDGRVKVENGLYYANMPVPVAPLRSDRDPAEDIDGYSQVTWSWTVGGVGWQMAHISLAMPDRRQMDNLCDSREILPPAYSKNIERFIRRCMEYGRFNYDVRLQTFPRKSPPRSARGGLCEIVPAAAQLKELHRCAEKNFNCHRKMAKYLHNNLIDYVNFLDRVRDLGAPAPPK